MKKGIDAKIFRLGRLVGRESDGKFQFNAKDNMFHLVIQCLSAVKVIPETVAGIPWDVMPVDIAAEQVVTLHNAEGNVFHIMNPQPPTLGEVFCAVDDSFKVVSAEEFEAVYNNSSALSRSQDALIRMNIFNVKAGPSIIVTCDKTTAALEKAGFDHEIKSLKTVMNEF
jgi:thioester reductase-like protein